MTTSRPAVVVWQYDTTTVDSLQDAATPVLEAPHRPLLTAVGVEREGLLCLALRH
jgi:hypothetical protein